MHPGCIAVTKPQAYVVTLTVTHTMHWNDDAHCTWIDYMYEHNFDDSVMFSGAKDDHSTQICWQASYDNIQAAINDAYSRLAPALTDGMVLELVGVKVNTEELE